MGNPWPEAATLRPRIQAKLGPPRGEDYKERIRTFPCTACGDGGRSDAAHTGSRTQGVIVAIYVNRRTLVLEGQCRNRAVFDILKIDNGLRCREP